MQCKACLKICNALSRVCSLLQTKHTICGIKHDRRPQEMTSSKSTGSTSLLQTQPQKKQSTTLREAEVLGWKLDILKYCMVELKCLVCHKMPDWKQVVGVCAFWCRPLRLQDRRRGGGENKSGRCGVKVGPADLKVQWVNLAGQGCNLDQYFLQF